MSRGLTTLFSYELQPTLLAGLLRGTAAARLHPFAVVWRRIRWHQRAQRAILTLESTGFEYRQRRRVDLTELPTSVHWQRPSPARSPQRAPTGLQRPMCASSCPLAPVGAPAAPCTRTWTSTGVTATAVTATDGRYMAVTWPLHTASTDHGRVLEPPSVLGLSPDSGVY